MRAFSKYPHTRILLAAAIVYLCSGCSDTRLSHRDALPHLRVESLLTLPLHDGTDGFDRLDRALRNHFDFGGGMNAPLRLETQKPATLRGGHVVRRYLRLDGRHLLVELDSAPCFSVERAITVSRPDPSRIDRYRSTGIYTATGRGMYVGFSADGVRRDCVTSFEIAKTSR